MHLDDLYALIQGKLKLWIAMKNPRIFYFIKSFNPKVPASHTVELVLSGHHLGFRKWPLNTGLVENHHTA
jgi:hypothetical protein